MGSTGAVCRRVRARRRHSLMVDGVSMAQRSRWRRAASGWLLASALAYGCGPAAPVPPVVASPRWTLVHEGVDPDNPGSTVRIAVDTTGTRPLADGVYLVWFETRHSRPRI